MFQGCYKIVARLLQSCFKDVARLLQSCYKVVAKLFRCSNRKLLCFKGVSKLLQYVEAFECCIIDTMLYAEFCSMKPS